jgi:hypothetical protein
VEKLATSRHGRERYFGDRDEADGNFVYMETKG